MEIFTDKKKLIQILFGLAFVFLVANLIVNKIIHYHYTPIEKARSAYFINSRFLVALQSYGLKSDWVKKTKRFRKEDDSLNYKYRVEVPKDLPIALLLDEIEDSLGVNGIVIKSNELKIGGTTLLKVFSGDNLKLQAEFNYDENIHRDAGTVGFIVKDAGQLSSSNFEKLIRLPERFALLLSPSKKTAGLQQEIISAQKEICVLISDESTDLTFKMKAGFPMDRIRNSIYSIISDYSNAAFFVLDNKSALYNSPSMSSIKKILDKSKIKYIKLSDCSVLNSGGTDAIRNQFEKIVMLSKAKPKSILMLTPDELYSQLPELVKFRKIGYQFVRPSVQLN
jgi:hypothetical protein